MLCWQSFFHKGHWEPPQSGKNTTERDQTNLLITYTKDYFQTSLQKTFQGSQPATNWLKFTVVSGISLSFIQSG